MNALDIFVLITLVLFAVNGWRQGLIHTVFRLLTFVVSLVLALFLYPFMALILRATPLYPALSRGINNALGLDDLAASAAARGVSLIDALPLPQMVLDTLHVNNNQQMHETLRTTGIQEYIAGFFANMIIVAASIILLFILFFVLISLAGAMLDVLSSLPIINTFNNLGGLLIGVVLGVAITGMVVFMLSLLANSHQALSNWLHGSYFARWVLGVLTVRFF